MNLKKYSGIQKALKQHNAYVKELEKLCDKIDELNKQGKENPKLSKKLDDLYIEFNTFKKTVFASAVYNDLKKDKPIIVNKKTGQTFKWDELFPSSVEELLKDPSKCSILVSIALENGRFTIK